MAGKTASDPYPPDGDTNGASPRIELSWEGGEDATGHEIYLGMNPAFQNGRVVQQSLPRWVPTGLTAGAKYYWRVDELNPNLAPFSWPGPVWSFTVFDSAAQPAGYQNGYAVWCVDTLTDVNLDQNPPAGIPIPPEVGIALAQGESASFQVAIQPAPHRRLDRVRLIVSDLNDGNGNVLPAVNIDWHLVGLVTAGGEKLPDVLLPVSHFNVLPDHTHSMLVTVLAPAGTHAGIYTGTLTVTTDGGLDTAVRVAVTVYPFAIPLANEPGSMNLRNSYTLSDFGGAAFHTGDYEAYGELMLNYRMSPDNIYRNRTPDPGVLARWYSKGLNTFSVYKADNLWHPTDLDNEGINKFFADLTDPVYPAALRSLAQFYGYDEKGLTDYGDEALGTLSNRQILPIGMSTVYEKLKDAYGDVATTTTCHLYNSPWADPVGDMIYYRCDRICAEASYYSYSDGELLRNTVKPWPPDNQRFQYWTYGPLARLGRPRLTTRTIFWSLFQQKCDGFLYFQTNDWANWQWRDHLSSPTTIDPASGPITNFTFSPTNAAGDPVAVSTGANLIYPGKGAPLASMRMVNLRDGMADWEYLRAIGHYDTDGVTRKGKIASVETARELAEQMSVEWVTDTDPAHLFSARDLVARWLSQPYVAKYPVPEHRSKGVSRSPELTWLGDSTDVTSFNVYFGSSRTAVLNAMADATEDSPEFKGNQSGTTYSPPSLLEMNTEYYWRIDEVVDGQVYKGYVWSFNCSYGLAAWWKFDEATGSTARDSSSLGRDAEIHNASPAPGVLNNCREFTGIGYVEVPDSVLFTVVTQVTVAFWLYGAEVQPQDEVLFEAIAADGTTVLRGRLPSSDNFAIIDAGRTDSISHRMKLTEARNRWQYWAFTKNSRTGSMKIYLNGALWAEAQGKVEPLVPATKFVIGAKCDGSLGYEGKIDEFRVYDRELSLAEITDLYHIAGYRGDQGLMGWWRFDELSGGTVKDWSDVRNEWSNLRNDGILRGGSREAGQVGNCLVFNGPTDFVEVPVDGLVFTDPEVSLSIWTFGGQSLPNANGSLAVEAIKNNELKSPALRTFLPLSDGTAAFATGDDGGAYRTITRLLQPNEYKGKWNHWVFARKHDGRSTVFLNGAHVVDNNNFSDLTCDVIGQLRIGAGCLPNPAVGSNPFEGKLDDIRLYNYELSPAEVLNIYNHDLTAFSGQIGGWRFDEGAGFVTADTSSFRHDGTLSSAIWTVGLRFSRANSYLSIPATALAPLDKEITVTVWLKSVGISRSHNWVFEALDSAGGPVVRAMVDRNRVIFDAGFGGAGQYDEVEQTLQSTIQAGLWTHWAFTKSSISGDMKIYREGVFFWKGTGKYRPFTPTAVFKIGSTADGNLSFNGIIYDVRIYNLELNLQDVYEIYLDSPPRPNPTDWTEVPRQAGPRSISMSAEASHPEGVEYYFECTEGGGHHSGWQASENYTDTGLEPSKQYSYQVKARKMTGPTKWETHFSPVSSATTP